MISPERFTEVYLEAYRTGKPSTWVAEKLGVTKQRISQRKQYLAIRGLKLPKLNDTPTHMNRAVIQGMIEAAVAEKEATDAINGTN